MATATKTLQGTSVMPSLTVNDLQRSLDFFAALGFEVEDRWEDNGVMLGAMLKAGNARLGLSQDDGKKGRDRVKGVGMRIYIEAADNIDEVATAMFLLIGSVAVLLRPRKPDRAAHPQGRGDHRASPLLPVRRAGRARAVRIDPVEWPREPVHR